MTESQRRISYKRELPASVNQNPELNLINSPNLNSSQKRDQRIISEITQNADEINLLLAYHIWHDNDASIDAVKKVSGIKDKVVIRRLLDQLMESDDLVEKYDEFSIRFREQG